MNYDKKRYEQLPWTEKYRPSELCNLSLDEKLQTKIQKFIDTKNIPNIIFAGPPGIGKTSTIRCVANELYGVHKREFVLELNASDDRGIKSMQEDIISFCKHSTNVYDTCPTYKLVILDEADNMVTRSQPQINIIMEKYKNKVKFAFTCNMSSNIIEGIQSRCLILRYNKLSKTLIANRLSKILDAETVKYKLDALEYICELANGDMRASINILQLVRNKCGKVTITNINTICDHPQQEIIIKLLQNIIDKNLKDMFSIIFELRNSGFNGYDIVLSMMRVLKSDYVNFIPEKTKIHIFNKICVAAYKMSKGSDTLLQLSGCMIDIV